MTRMLPIRSAGAGASARPRGLVTAVAIAAMLALAACQTPGEGTPAAQSEAGPGAAATPSAQGGAEARPIGEAGVAGREAAPAAGTLSPLKDPSNILSKRSIYYDFDKYDIKDDDKPIVDAHAKYLREHPEAKVLIQGNTDERGSREYNIGLGQRRADGVKRLLILLGVKEEQIEAVSLGEEKPRATGSSEAAYAENRRSDILYRGEY